MTGTMEGLSVPINGEFYRYSASQVQNLFVEDSGVTNLTVKYTGTTADQALAVDYSTSGTQASGYGAGIFVGLGVAGTSTGGFASTQQNAFATDVTVNGTHTCGIGGLYVYLAEGTATLTTAQIYGGYFDIGTDFGTVDYLSCITLDKHNTTKGTTVDAFILCQLQGSGTGTTIIQMQGPAKPTYLLNMSDATVAGMLDADSRQAATSTSNLAVRVGGTTKYIQLLTAT